MRLEFDRGTILCAAAAKDEHVRAARLPGVVWDGRVGAYRASGHQYRAIQQYLREARAEVHDEVLRLEPLRVGRGTVALRPYQEAGLQSWDVAQRRGLVCLPTGSGKTLLAVEAIRRCATPAICLVPTRVLLEQWRACLEKELGVTVGVFGDGQRELRPVTVATFASAYAHMPKLGNRFGLLVVDEVHHFGTGLQDEALEACAAPWRLGLTATPPTSGGSLHRLVELVGPVVTSVSIDELTGTYLAEYDLYSMALPLSPEERAAYEDHRSVFAPLCRVYFRNHPGDSWGNFVRVLQSTKEGRRAFFAWQRMTEIVAFTRAKAAALDALLARHHDARVLVFAATNDAVYRIARRHLIMPITCEIGRAERAWALGAFGKGELRALASGRVLNEGLDVPQADVGIIVGGAHGEREHVQRVGRLLRPAPGKRAVIYELFTEATSEVTKSQRRRRALATPASTHLPNP